MEPALTDPLCQAVARATAQGLIVAVSAGNAGRDATGHRVLGGIGSPANSPFALTVGALNNWSTAARSDDTVADYSSRGPTKFDFAVKPDLAAPGTGIESLEAAGSYLPAMHPSIHTAGSGKNAYMRLSGTSMAAPMVSGAVALLLQGSPGLSGSQAKLALQSGASFVADTGLMGAGAGSLNIWASRSMAATGSLSVAGPLGGGTPSGVSFWDAGTLAAGVYEGIGVRLLSVLDVLTLWSHPSVLMGELNLSGTLNPLGSLAPNQLIWGDEAGSWSSGGHQIIWGTTIYDSGGNQIIWGTSGDASTMWGTTDMTSPTAK